MILVADSGSTKTSWSLINQSKLVSEFSSIGLNPYHVCDSAIDDVLNELAASGMPMDKVDSIYFYGSGCAQIPMQQRMVNILGKHFSKAIIHVFSDILGAARALYGNQCGIVAIVGTGLNCGYYNGSDIESITPSLGYVLGDEGSGCHLGKLLLAKWQYGELPNNLSDKLAHFAKVDLAEVLKRVYHEPNPQQFIASFVPFIVKHIEYDSIVELVDSAFNMLVERHLVKYPQFTQKGVGVVGSVGYALQQRLMLAIEKKGGRLNRVLQYPISSLTEYHAKTS
ncbi:MAG TPA: hypothetical protein ENN24_00950 [Bacteroidetes bacterium]|nr:hypothetical protein [Bacteroidota bacterium]